MARYSNAHSGHAPMVFGSWVLAKAACAALAITAVAVLAGCGGGGGAATPDTPTVTPSAVTLTLVSAKVMLADGGNNVVVYTALGNKGADGGNIDITATTTWVPTFMGQALEAGATLQVSSNGHLQEVVAGITTDLVVTPGVTVNVGGTATYAGKTVSVTPTILTGGCETGLVATGGKCKVPAFRMGAVFSFDKNTMIEFVNLTTGIADPADTIVWNGTAGKPFLNVCLATLTPGAHGGLVMSCSVIVTAGASATFATVEVAPGGKWWLVDNVDHRSEPDYVSARYSLARPVCTNGVTRVAPGSTGDEMCWGDNLVSLGSTKAPRIGINFAVLFDTAKK